MMERMSQALVSIGFLPAENPEHIMFALRAIFGRAGVSARELDILSGIARQIRWFAEGGFEAAQAKHQSGKKLR
jgi:tRNA/rRNA methyltransferase